MDLSVARRGGSELFMHYPIHLKEASWLHTPPVAAWFRSFVAQFVPEDFVSKIRLGCEYPGYAGRITVLYMMPSPEEAEERLVQRTDLPQWGNSYRHPSLHALFLPNQTDLHRK